MIENLVIVESPAKAKTIEKFLGKKFAVRSSMGHIRDLAKKNFGIDLNNNFEPQYIVPDDKKKIVAELKKSVKDSGIVWLASDEDREGEAIAWHLYEVLKLKPDNTRRIVFHEITKEAILNSINNYRGIDRNLVNAQQARRVLDRIVGFELSPVLWKKVKPSLSAGRVQSVAVRLVVEREREIINFTPSSAFRVTGNFHAGKEENSFKADASTRFSTKEKAEKFLDQCLNSEFTVKDITTKPSKKSPAPPFTTSTLQQEASRKLGFSVSQTMTIAQRLYEAGKITYMRTDSVNLSTTAMNSAKKIIDAEYGEKYVNPRNFTTKSKSAQEAHEAIRPTYIENKTIQGNNTEKKLYELIRKRTLASQMSDARLEKTTVTIDVSESKENFIATGEILIFDGFLKVYIESTDDEQEEETKGLLPPVKKEDNLTYSSINAVQRYTSSPPRYTEASLVKKLEELGIGRPSTYAPTISTIQNRGYVIKEDRPGKERKIISLLLENRSIKEQTRNETYGSEKAKLFPDNIGMIVNDFLVEYFDNILDYNFTASIEKEFDDIASGKLNWTDMIGKFYKPFHNQVEETLEVSDYSKGERMLGKDPDSGKPVIARMGRYGPIVQIGENDPESNEKPKYAGLLKGQQLETITLEEAMNLFRLPRKIGTYEGKDMVAAIGRFGPYVRHDSKFYSMAKDIDDPFTITAERAVELIESKRERERNRIIKTFDEEPGLQVLNGRWGPYISFNNKNYRIPRKTDPKNLTLEQCHEIINESSTKKKKKS